MTRLRPALHQLAVATVLAFGSLAMTAAAQSVPMTTASYDGTLLSVASQAEVHHAPDIATLSAGVVTQAADANTALRRNAEQMAKVVAAIRAAGVADRDVQTSGVNLNPQYRYVENLPPAITGYQASNNVNVIVRDVAKIGRTLDALVATGANQVNGPSFDIDQKEPVLDEARRAALDKARKRADMYAQALGLHVRRIVSIDETGGAAIPRPMPMMAMAKMARDESTPISPGENVLSVSLNVIFELGK